MVNINDIKMEDYIIRRINAIHPNQQLNGNIEIDNASSVEINDR